MAITRFADLWDTTDTVAANSYTFANVGAPTSGQKYLVVVSATQATTHVSVDSITGTNGWNASFTLLQEATLNSAAAYSIAVYEVIAASAVDGDIVVSFDGDATGCALVIDTADDLETGATAKVQSGAGSGVGATSATLSGALNAFGSASNYCYLAVAKQETTEAITAEAGGVWATTAADQVGASPNIRVGTLYRVGEDTSPTATWTSATRFVAAAVELAVSAGGGGDPAPAASGNMVRSISWTSIT